MFPHELGLQKRILAVTFNVTLDSVANPITRQTGQIQQRIDESQLSLKAVAEQSEGYRDFIDGIVLSNSDVQLKGEWRVQQLVTDAIAVDSIDDRSVTFNQDIWSHGLDVVVKDLQHQMAHLVDLVDSVEEALRSRQSLFKVFYVDLQLLLCHFRHHPKWNAGCC